ncbi:hypothetical protein ABZ372_13020, partial [Streptomyces sp. NPDC005921]
MPSTRLISSAEGASIVSTTGWTSPCRIGGTGRLAESVGGDTFDEDSLPALIRAASADPDAF